MSKPLVMWDFDRTLAKGWFLSTCFAEVLKAEEPELHFSREDISARFRSGFPWQVPDVEHPQPNEPDAWWSYIHTNVLVPGGLSLGLSSARAHQVARLTRTLFPRKRGFEVYPDSLPALRLLSEAGWDHVIVSNHCPELEEITISIGLRDAVDAVYTSARTGYEKPHPEMFRMVLARHGNPSSAWMVGDSPTADIAGAAALGIRGLLVTREGEASDRAVRTATAAAEEILS